MRKHWPQMRCPKYLCDCSNKQQYRSDCLSLQFYSFLPSATVMMHLPTAASPEEDPLRACFRARAITCPIFQCFVCLCEIMSANCQSSCILRHSYMHDHASYMFMHLIKLSCYSYASAFSIPMLTSVKINHVNFKFLLLMTNVYCHVNFKVQQSCSNIPVKFKLLQLCQSNSVHFQIQFVSVNGQVAGSYPRTACACQFVLVFGQVASSHPRTACTYPFGIRRAASSDPRTARAFYFVSCQPSN